MAGKAIVINGIVVSNPLTTITFRDADSVLAAYLSKNDTISSSETDALKALVGGLLSANLWDKVHYFYPMLGNAVTDMILDAVNPDMEDLFNENLGGVANTTGLSVNNRTLRVTGRSLNSSIVRLTTERIKSLDMRNVGIVSSLSYTGDVAADVPANSDLILTFDVNYGKKMFGLQAVSGDSNYRYPLMICGVDNDTVKQIPTGSSDGGNNLSYKQRIVLGDYNGDICTLYKDKVVYKTGVNYATTQESYRLSGIACNGSANNLDYSALAIVKHLSADEWGAFYDLLLAFLKAVGKHS